MKNRYLRHAIRTGICNMTFQNVLILLVIDYLMELLRPKANPLQPYSGAKSPNTECRVEWFSKCSLDSLQKLHAIRDTVKCQYSCSMIQVDANTGWHRPSDFFAFVIVHKGVFGVSAVQTPGLVIPAQAAFVSISFATDSPVGDGHVYFCSPPVHFPVTTRPSNTLPAQDLKENWRYESSTSNLIG